jgi:hypothetical protein
MTKIQHSPQLSKPAPGNGINYTQLANIELIHYGHNKFDSNEFDPIKNTLHGWVKPFGGLWLSPANNNDWFNWCIENEFRLHELITSFTVTLKPTAKVLTINSYSDLKFIVEHSKYGMSKMIVEGRVPNFENLAQDYDAMYLTKKGLNETHLSLPYNLYGWDCESILLFHYKHIVY